ncbi:virion core protein [Tanapox virus]|uniref:39kDa core protein OPG130 n=1 Tax=Tanapox virus TaxID=99000 RepID=A7XCM3_9POXV|nr:virion core protein [Tanapox virus]ABQ43725.1 virion core protein [Tanapox virus]
MDFMSKYSKELVLTAKNIKDEEPNLNKKETSFDLSTYLKTKETHYQKKIRDQLAEKNMLRVTELVTPIKVIKNEPPLVDNIANACDNNKMEEEIENIKKEYESIKDETSSLQEETKKLVDDISTARETTMEALNSIMKELTQKIQTGNLIGN